MVAPTYCVSNYYKPTGGTNGTFTVPYKGAHVELIGLDREKLSSRPASPLSLSAAGHASPSSLHHEWISSPVDAPAVRNDRGTPVARICLAAVSCQ